MCKRILFSITVFIFTLFFLSSCDTAQNKFAPVTNGWKSSAASQVYRVQKSDTLYSIAFRFGLDVNQLAKTNNIAAPYRVHPRQMINLLPGATDSTIQIVSAPEPTVPAATPASLPTSPVVTQSPPVATGPVGQWTWPASGKIIQPFSDTYGGNKGLDIAGNLNDPVRAAAAGKVVYCGTGLRGYGLLIIIKHNKQYLSAYAHNSNAQVKEGDVVKQGQVIAKMGSSDATRVMLHFEIRQSGRPVDPLKLLPPRKGS